MKEKIIQRFLNYVSIDTQSDENSDSSPSTEKQFHLLHLLQKELQNMGLQDISLSPEGVLMGTLPSNCKRTIPPIGFIAHVDTATNISGANVQTQRIDNYSGKDIFLKGSQTSISQKDYPFLKNYIGQTIITTDGTTLLGADDKAGITAIITATEVLKNSCIEHGTIHIAFTPDEEIGCGTDHFDTKTFGAKYAYTVDGGELGELEYENFNAASATLTIKGIDIHPGSAKDIMVNAQLLAIDFQQKLPQEQRPENTDGYQGFFLLESMEGCVAHAKLKYIIRDHDFNAFEQKKQLLKDCCDQMQEQYPQASFLLEIKDQYYNMKDKILPCSFIIDIARKAMEINNVQAKVKPIRGGTDGARLSYMGLPCPNIFTGGHNFHSEKELLIVESLQKAIETLVTIARLFANTTAQ